MRAGADARPGDTQPLVASAQWYGSIARLARGAGGFGYDPLFLPQGMAQSAAELAPEEKNRISHAARRWRNCSSCSRAGRERRHERQDHER